MALPYGAMCLSTVVIVVFPDHTHLLFLSWESYYMLKVVDYDAYLMTFNSIDTMKAIKNVK